MTDALTIWRDLADTAPSRAGIIRRRVLPESARDIFLAVRQPGGERLLILGVSADAVGTVLRLPSSRSVRTTVVHLDDGRAEVRVALTSPEMLRVFAPFVEDVAAWASREDSDAGAVQAFTTRFAHWRRLLAGEVRRGMSREAAQGLWGELWVLRHALYPCWGDAVIDAWTGADFDDKDFRSGALAVEVKTTHRDVPQAVKINGERQLEVPSGSSLLLVILDTESHEHGTGETLNDAVDAVQELVGAEALERFDEKLASYGYVEGDRELYRDMHYILRRLLWHQVVDAFPRLTAAELPPGIGSVTYLLAVDACGEWRVEDEQHVESLLRASLEDR